LFCILKEFQLRQIYDYVDKDGNGLISHEEFSTGMRELGWNATEKKLKKVFHRLDDNSDSGLSYREFRQLVGFSQENSESAEILRNVADEFHKTRMTSFDVGGFNLQASKPRDLSALANLAAGFIAGSISRTLTAPAERLKTELQVASGKPPSLMALCRQISADGGARAFFQGNLANCLKVAPQSALFFALMDCFKKTLPTKGSPQFADVHSFLCGSLAGITSQFIIYPLEPIKTCLTVAPKGRYAGILDCGRQMYQQRGLKGLYGGALPTLAGCIPYSGVQFVVYDALQRAYLKTSNNERPSFGVTFASGLASSTLAMTVSYPLVVIRTKLQVQGTNTSQPLLYSGVLDCFQKTWIQDGPRGLVRGIVPNLVKAAPAAAVNLAIFEKAKNLLVAYSSAKK
jgi:solute carrier family 25 phosphate transporter 23/24/25/41